MNGLCNINHITNHKMGINIDRITDPLIHDSQCYSMNKIWNVESNSMMIEWFVNDQCVIDDNNEQEYGIDGMESIHNKWKWWLNEYGIQIIWYKT